MLKYRSSKIPDERDDPEVNLPASVISRSLTFVLFFVAIFLQAGAYGLTFLLPRLFGSFGANEKVVGVMLMVTSITAICTVYFSGHLTDKLGRLFTLSIACLAIAGSLFLLGSLHMVGVMLVLACSLLGFGWALTYSLAPVVLTQLVSASQRVQYFAVLSVAVMAGFGLSPVLSSLLEKFGYSLRDSFYLVAAACLISAVLFFILSKPIKIYALNPRSQGSSRITLKTLSEVLTSRALLPIVMVFLGASVFAGLNNFQTVFAEERRINYAIFFLLYMITVIVFRLALVKYKGGKNPYLTVSILQYIMCGSAVLFIFSGESVLLYVVVGFLFGLGYGVSYPVLVALAANDANQHLEPQTLQLFALSYFIGIFGFPLIAGWLIVEFGTTSLLVVVAILAAMEASMALYRAFDAYYK